MKQFIIKQNYGLSVDTVVELPLVDTTSLLPIHTSAAGRKINLDNVDKLRVSAENLRRERANTESEARYAALVAEGKAFEYEELEHPLDEYEIKAGKLVHNPERAKDKRNALAMAKRRRDTPPDSEIIALIMNWLATETEFGIPAKLKSIAMKCQAAKSNNPIED